MKTIIKLFLLLCISFSSVFSNEQTTIKAKELYLSYETYPKRVFTGQKFDIKLQAIILENKNSYDKVVTTFSSEENIEILTKDIQWTEVKTGNYTTTISYKVFDKQFVLPKITVALVKDDNIVNHISVDSPLIKYEKIAVNQKLFSNIIAKDIKVHSVKTKQYNNNILHTTLHIEGINSNLEDIKIANYEDQGIKSFSENYPNQSLYYYMMVPSYTKQINFTYYNSVSNDFIMIQIPIILDEELVSTQTELNPYNSSILIYKQILSGVILLIVILLYAFTRQNRYLILITIAIAVLAYLFIPNKKVLLEKDTKVYILPTNNSTIYKVLESKDIVEVINQERDFVKVLFQNDNIGWVKKNDIEED